MRKRPAVELPKYVQHVIDGGRDYYYFLRGRGSKTPGLRITRPSDPPSEEFWRAYRAALGGDTASGKCFDDLITAYRVSPQFTKRAAATRPDYLRYSTSCRGRGARYSCLSFDLSTSSSCATSGQRRQSPQTTCCR